MSILFCTTVLVRFVVVVVVRLTYGFGHWVELLIYSKQVFLVYVAVKV